QQAFQPNGEASLGGHAVAESLQVVLEGLQGQVRLLQSSQVVSVKMQALATRDQLGATEDQVEGVGVLRPLGIGMGVEWAAAPGIARDKEEIAAEFPLCPFAQPAFVLRR